MLFYVYFSQHFLLWSKFYDIIFTWFWSTLFCNLHEKFFLKIICSLVQCKIYNTKNIPPKQTGIIYITSPQFGRILVPSQTTLRSAGVCWCNSKINIYSLVNYKQKTQIINSLINSQTIGSVLQQKKGHKDKSKFGWFFFISIKIKFFICFNIFDF